MRTKVGIKNNIGQGLTEVSVKITYEQVVPLRSFFALSGMVKQFLLKYENYTRRMVDHALSTGNIKINLLKDMREFRDQHIEEVKEFIKDTVDGNPEQD